MFQIWCNANSTQSLNLHKKPQQLSSIKRTIAHIEVNNCEKIKSMPSITAYSVSIYRVIKMIYINWELHMILAFAISIMLPFTYRCSYEDSQWKANKFPPLCRQNLDSQAAAELLRQPALPHYVFTQCKWEQPSGTDWESGRAHRTSLYLQLFKDKRVSFL